jgi:hypothetical protein
VNSIGPMHKSYSGADRSHGTAASRGQNPGAAAKRLMIGPYLARSRDDETRGKAQGKTACGFETLKGVVTREADESCEGNENPMSVAGTRNTGQAAIIARLASPVRG